GGGRQHLTLPGEINDHWRAELDPAAIGVAPLYFARGRGKGGHALLLLLADVADVSDTQAIDHQGGRWAAVRSNGRGLVAPAPFSRFDVQAREDAADAGRVDSSPGHGRRGPRPLPEGAFPGLP